MTSTAGPGRPRRWTAGLAWALWLASLLCLAAVPWLDELLRQAGRADLVQLTFPGVAVPVLATPGVAIPALSSFLFLARPAPDTQSDPRNARSSRELLRAGQ